MPHQKHRLKFTDELSKKILQGEKNTTWRLFDDKNLRVKDELILVNAENDEEFGEAMIISVKEITFQNLTKEDWAGHEKFKDKKETLSIYSNYYETRVKEETMLKVVKFTIKE